MGTQETLRYLNHWLWKQRGQHQIAAGGSASASGPFCLFVPQQGGGAVPILQMRNLRPGEQVAWNSQLMSGRARILGSVLSFLPTHCEPVCGQTDLSAGHGPDTLQVEANHLVAIYLKNGAHDAYSHSPTHQVFKKCPLRARPHSAYGDKQPPCGLRRASFSGM